MSKPPEVVPPPPDGVTLSPVPNLNLTAAAEWCATALDLHLKVRYLKDSATACALRVHLIGGKRYVSTEELWRFITSRPGRKAEIAPARPRPYARPARPTVYSTETAL